MNWVAIYVAALAGCIVLSVTFAFKLPLVVLLWGFVALLMAYPVLHKVPNKNLASGLFVGLAVFASFPLKKLTQLEDVISSILITLVYAGLLYGAGQGWKRSWT